MKRDMDLIRNILLTIERCDDVPPKMLRNDSFLDLCDNPQVISLHIELLIEAGYLESKSTLTIDGLKNFEISRITFAGYEYLDTVRDPKVWRNVKDKISKLGGAAFDIILELAKAEVTKELGL